MQNWGQDLLLLLRSVECCRPRGSCHQSFTITVIIITASLAEPLLQLDIFSGQLASFNSQSIVLCLKPLILRFNLREHGLQLVHSLLLSVASSLCCNAVLQLPSHEPFFWSEVCKSFSLLRLSVDAESLCHRQRQGGRSGAQRSRCHHAASSWQRGDHNGLGRYHCHPNSSL